MARPAYSLLSLFTSLGRIPWFDDVSSYRSVDISVTPAVAIEIFLARFNALFHPLLPRRPSKLLNE